MAGVVDEIEDFIVALLILAVIGVAAWFILNASGASVPGLNDLVDTVKGWFGSNDDSGSSGGTEWLSPEGSGIPSEQLSPPTQAQIDNAQAGIDDYEQFANSPEAWQDQAFDWFFGKFTGQGTGDSQLDQQLQPF